MAIESFAKVVALRKDIEALALVQKMQNEAKWEAFGSMPSPPGDHGPGSILDNFIKGNGANFTLPALGEVDSGSSALAGSTARLAFTAIEASAAAPDTYVAGIESFQSKEGALFDVKDFDGGGGGIFVLAENNVNRPVNIAVPSVLTEERAEDEAEDEAGAEDEEMPGLEDSDDDDEPLGPRVENQPMIALPPNVPQAVVYCTSCHQDVTPTHFNFCPECSITDACVPVNSNIANACREARVINHQKVIPQELRDAITRHTTRKLLLRMKEEDGAEPGSGGLPPKPAFRYVALGGPNDLAFSRMQTSALAESDFGDCAFTTVPSARTYPPDDIVMALPVEVSEVPDEYPENLRNLAPAATPPSCDFCQRAVAHSCCVRCHRRGCKSCVIRGWCTACLGPPYPPRRWPVGTTAGNASSRMIVLGPQRADVSVAVLTVQVVGSTDVVASPRRVLVLTGPVLGPNFTASRMPTFCVFAFQLGTVRCPDTTVATGGSSPARWFWFVATIASICWTALLFRRTPTQIEIESPDEETQTDFDAPRVTRPDRVVTTHSGTCYHIEGCH